MNVTGTGIAVAIGVVLVGGFLFFGNAISTFLFPTTATKGSAVAPTDLTTQPSTMNPQDPQTTNPTDSNEAPQAATTLSITDKVVGTGAEATPGKSVTVHYVGTLPNGTVFDSSKKRGQPFVFTLGAGQVIQGWDQGVQGMKVGGIRTLIIPPDLGYGSQGAGGVIPPNATLIFEVELLDVK